MSTAKPHLLMPLVYNLALLLASPLLLGVLVYRVLVLKKSREGLHERFGWMPSLAPPPPAGRLWLHAVSAGEAVAAAAIIERLRKESPGLQIVLSTTTPAGRKQAERVRHHLAALVYFPFDLLPCVLLALGRLKPTAVAAVETEIWPNWLWLSRATGRRTALVNGQITHRGYSRASRVAWLYRWCLSCLDGLLMQHDEAATRVLALGAPSKSTRAAGNVKFDQPHLDPTPETRRLIEDALGLGRDRGNGRRNVWVAASTHPGEDELVLTAFRQVRERIPGACLILAPRHIERSEQVAALAAAGGWNHGRRTELPSSAAGGEPLDVLVLDTMGELAGLYALADVAFVGGSLVPIGGHDCLQPLFHGTPVAFGPHMHNQRDLARATVQAGAAVEVKDAAGLADEVTRLCADSVAAAEMRAAGLRVLEANRGAALECAIILARLAAVDSPQPVGVAL
jgi:3-deoxy-D-manno-octulosonic-acid transferase